MMFGEDYDVIRLGKAGKASFAVRIVPVKYSLKEIILKELNKPTLPRPIPRPIAKL